MSITPVEDGYSPFYRFLKYFQGHFPDICEVNNEATRDDDVAAW